MIVNWRHPFIELLLRLTFGGMLIYAAIDKILFPIEFARVVENYQVFGAVMSRWVAVWLPYLELATGLLLVCRFWPDAATLLNVVMMALFLIAVSQAYQRGLDISCGCFGNAGASITAAKVFINAMFLLSSLYLFGVVRSRSTAADQ